MSDTHRRHVPKSKLAKSGGQPKVRSATMLLHLERADAGGGVHTKSHKQRRVNERARLKKEWL
jgi:hypothetical protein